MFFKGKSKEEKKCNVCSSKISGKYSFCPHCGGNLLNKEEEIKEYGMLGRNDFISQNMPEPNLGLADKVILNLFNNLVKTLDVQFRELEKTEISNFPNGIKIRIGSPPRKKARKQQAHIKEITDKQMGKMNSLPRAAAKSSVRRFSDKVVYELSTPGVNSLDDVFVSKLESGYEIKAIGEKKIYVNSLPVNLPLHNFAISNDKLLVEFNTREDF